MTCPCPKHPFGCFNHPEGCGCPKAERLALAQMVYEAVRFANFMAGEGISPQDDCKEARDPALFLTDYVTAIGGDDYEGLAELARDAILTGALVGSTPVTPTVHRGSTKE